MSHSLEKGAGLSWNAVSRGLSSTLIIGYRWSLNMGLSKVGLVPWITSFITKVQSSSVKYAIMVIAPLYLFNHIPIVPSRTSSYSN